MRELINLIEGAQDTQEPIVEEASEWQWQKLYEYNLKAVSYTHLRAHET